MPVSVTVKVPTLPLWAWCLIGGLVGLLLALYHFHGFWPTWSMGCVISLIMAIVLGIRASERS